MIKISNNDRQLKSFKDKCDQINNQIKLEEGQLKKLLKGHLLSHYDKEKDALWQQVVFLKKVTDLKSQRSNLKDGQPCPLCGSKDHPYAKISLPDKSETEKKIEQLNQLIQKAKDLELKIEEYKKSKEQYSDKCNFFEKEEIQYVSQKKSCENDLKNLKQEISDKNEKLRKLKEEILNELKFFGIQEVSEENIILLECRLEKWKEQKQCEEKIKLQKNKLENDLNSLNILIRNDNPLMVKKEKELKNLEKEYKGQIIKRQDLFGDKDPDKEEERLTVAISKANQTEKGIQSKYNKIQRDIHSIRESIKSLEKNISKRNDELQVLEIAFKDHLKSSNFVDEQDFKDSRLSREEQMQLTSKERELDDKKTRIKAKKEEQEKALAQETNKKVTQLKVKDAILSQTNLKENLNTMTKNIAELEHKLKDNKQSKEKFEKQQIFIEKQKKEYSRWEKLGNLIASADGKKYRNFAQGLTFNLMVSHANKQLEKITDRYLLIHDNERPLELNVIDSYQAGEIRPVKNLSGGESFIVSLALALGLSKMASRKVRVDSLFLDEGFGTLDENTLETALEALANLQQDGKLIGIISHISALKERINTQIHITPTLGGKSLIKGPGVQKV